MELHNDLDKTHLVMNRVFKLAHTKNIEKCESLRSIEAANHCPFAHSDAWFDDSVMLGKRTTTASPVFDL